MPFEEWLFFEVLFNKFSNPINNLFWEAKPFLIVKLIEEYSYCSQFFNLLQPAPIKGLKGVENLIKWSFSDLFCELSGFSPFCSSNPQEPRERICVDFNLNVVVWFRDGRKKNPINLNLFPAFLAGVGIAKLPAQ